MKKILIMFLVILVNLYSSSSNESTSTALEGHEQESCKEHLKVIEGTFFSKLPELTINEVDLAHSFSSSSMMDKGLGFLKYDTKTCTKYDGETIEHYWSIVSLFSLNIGKILIPKERVEEYESETEEFAIENPFLPTDNERQIKANIKKIIKYYNSYEGLKTTLNDYNVESLDKALQDLRASFTDIDNKSIDLKEVNKKLFSVLKIKTKKKTFKQQRKSPAIFLSKIVEAKRFYNNPSWLAMNFYNKEKLKAIDEDGGILENPFLYIESELLTKDMNDTEGRYKYILFKNGEKNLDVNKSKKYHYFLAEDGVVNPMNEMKATLYYFFDNPSKTKERICNDYPNRYVLLKKIFKENDTFQEASQNVTCPRLSAEMKFSYGYFTTGKDTSESFGHSILYIETKGKYERKIKPLDSRYSSKSITNKNNLYLNFAVDDPEEGILNNISYNIGGFTGNISGKFRIQDQIAIDSGYRNRMLIIFPISALDTDIEKKELLSAQIQHIQDNINNFSIPYKFMSRNCAYVLSNILEVAFPDLRSKFNENGYFAFKPKDVIKLMKGKIDVSKHKAIRL